MYLEATCTSVTMPEWERLMEGATRMDKRKLNRMVKKELPDLYSDLCLSFCNPYDYFKTKTHYILVHSAIEYFINREEQNHA